MTRATYARLLGVTLLLTAISAFVMVQIDWNGEAASEQAGPIDTLLDVMIAISCFVFALVVVLLAYAIWKYRAKPGDESDGEPIHGNTRLEIAWTLIPTIIVLFGAGYSWVVLDDIEAKADDRMPINVTAQQFKWTFEYPEEGITTTELHVIEDRQIELKMEALDVLHSFWVPEWRIKRDLVPEGPGGDGVDDQVVITPNEAGTYSLLCTELCGLGHATMQANVVVESQADFDQWVADQQAAQGGGPGTSSSGGGSAADGT